MGQRPGQRCSSESASASPYPITHCSQAAAQPSSTRPVRQCEAATLQSVAIACASTPGPRHSQRPPEVAVSKVAASRHHPEVCVDVVVDLRGDDLAHRWWGSQGVESMGGGGGGGGTGFRQAPPQLCLQRCLPTLMRGNRLQSVWMPSGAAIRLQASTGLSDQRSSTRAQYGLLLPALRHHNHHHHHTTHTHSPPTSGTGSCPPPRPFPAAR